MKTWVKILLALVVIGIIAAFFVYRYVYNKPHPDYRTEKASFTMEAGQLYNDFKTGGDAASKKYTGQVIIINGTLNKVEKADSLVIAVFVFSGGDFGDEGIRCTLLPEFNEMAGKLTSGTMVSLKGYCTGYNGTDIIFEKCSFINPKPEL